MQLEQGFELAAPPAVVWQAFHELELLVGCLPGAALDPSKPSADPGDAALLFKVKLGPIAASFAGIGRLELDEASRSGRFAGSAVDARTASRVKGEARFEVLPTDTGTRVALVVDYTISGALAQFGRAGITRALAEELTRQFAANLQAALPQVAQVAQVPPASQASHAPQPAPQPAPQLAPPPEDGPIRTATGVDTTSTAVADRAIAAAASSARAAAPAARPPAAPVHAPLDLWALLRHWFRSLWRREPR
jgi:carbon monoxide dehydrogenase subunit G